jgi:2-iminobutanoate/2-iminopropanoate deaminase
MKTIDAKKAPKAIGPYSHAVRSGPFLFVSGTLGTDPATGELVSATVEAQTRQALDNLRAILEEGGSSLSQVIKCDVFLIDLADYEAVNRLYAEVFGSHKPARALVQVAALPRGSRIEIACIAEVVL